MATSRRARLAGVGLGALAVACGSCTAPVSNDAKLHLATAPEDFTALGIGKEIGGPGRWPAHAEILGLFRVVVF
jgi:hypothetical protein